jgi:hypothetical protein
MGEVDDSLEVQPFQEGEIQLVTLPGAAEVMFYHPIVAWRHKVRHGLSTVCSPTTNQHG